MKSRTAISNLLSLRPLGIGLLLCGLTVADAGAVAISNVPLYLGTSTPPNVLFILANSQNMDENGDPQYGMIGAAVGSSSPHSKSEIARAAIRGLEDTYIDQINLGLMTFDQDTPSKYYIYNSYYDASYDPANYDPSYTCPAGTGAVDCRASTTKLYEAPNPTSPGDYIYYNYASPFYDSHTPFSANFCYSGTAAFDNTTNIPAGSDTYSCYATKTGTSDAGPTGNGYSTHLYNAGFGPTDSDYANDVLDFGKRVPSVYAATAWFSNSSPGGGYLQVPLTLLDNTQQGTINAKLVCNVPDVASMPNLPTGWSTDHPNPTPTSGACNSNSSPTASSVLNAGLTPIEGTIDDAASYFKGNTIPDACGKNFVVLLTNGLPSVDATGTTEKLSNGQIDTCTMTQKAVTAATNLYNNGSGPKLYVVGYALPPFALQYYDSMCGSSGNPLDDLATAGGTGSAFMATDPSALQSTLGSVFTDILQSSGSSAALTSNSTSIGTSSYAYQAGYNTSDWSGHLKAYPVTTSGASSSASWDAATLIPSSGRTLLTYDGSSGTTFAWSYLSSDEQCLLAGQAAGCTLTTAQSTAGQQVLDYISGDTSQSLANGGSLRNRSSLLGDIVNSDPLYLSADDYGYSILPASDGGGSAYGNFVADKTHQTLYVGANDGMLHAFDAATGDELFAYVPSAVYANLPALTQPSYNANHRYYVDGSAGSGDAYYKGHWHTILVGTLGSGGKSIFALNVTDPTTMSSNDVLWEFSDATDLGYTWGKPAVALFNDGHYYAVVNNGYDSASKKAVLFLIQVDDPSNVIKLDAGTGGNVCSDDGLSQPALLDANGNGTIDAIYAGDLCGNVWKFDVSSSNTSQWAVAFKSGSTYYPLFTAQDSAGNFQPITAPVVLGSVPSGVSGTAMVFFGTGQYLNVADATNTDTQTLYGVLDNSTFSSGSGLRGSFSGGQNDLSRSDLQQQTITYEGTVDGQEVRSVSTNSVTYTGTGPQYGWYLDLLEPTGTAQIGERVIHQAQLVSGRAEFVTLIPNIGNCSYGGSSWAMGLDAATGGAPQSAFLDVDQNNVINSDDNISVTSGGTTSTAVVVGTRTNTIGSTPISLKGSSGSLAENCMSLSDGTIKCWSEQTNLGNPRASWTQIQ